MVQELVGVVDYTTFNPAANSVFSNVQTSNYWSATSDASFPTGANAWFVNFSNGNVLSVNTANTRFVWCVRSGP